jgi:hypothetical protein
MLPIHDDAELALGGSLIVERKPQAERKVILQEPRNSERSSLIIQFYYHFLAH